MKKFIAVAVALVGFTNHPSRAEDKVDFAKQIQPILQQNCVKCHGPEKQKAKMRLDSKEAAMKGGKDGVILVAGNAEKSEIYRRITLPKGNDDIMPNEGDPLTKEQTDLIRDWINQGADWPETGRARDFVRLSGDCGGAWWPNRPMGVGGMPPDIPSMITKTFAPYRA